MIKLHKSEAIWQDRVIQEMEMISRKKQFGKKYEIAKAWKNNNDVKICNASFALGSGVKNGIAEMSTMALTNSTPTMAMWAPIEMNVFVKHQETKTIPTVGEDLNPNDQNSIANLVEEINSKMTITENIGDQTFLTLVQNLSVYDNNQIEKSDDQHKKHEVLYRPKSDLEIKWIEASTEDPTLPSLIVFQAISSSYPECGSTNDLIKKYKSLTDHKLKLEKVPNIDGPTAKAVTAEKSLHHYKSLLCRRCFMFGCPLHNDPYVDTPIITPSNSVAEPPLPTTPCGVDCYLSGRNSPTENSSYSPPLILSPSNDLKNNEDVWTGSEVTLFRILVKSLPSNWCKIAQVMITKKCKQVWQFSKEEVGIIAREKKTKTSDRRKKKSMKALQDIYKAQIQRGEIVNKNQYFPCHHPGEECSMEVCTCRQRKTCCEKFCYCPANCEIRFPGCQCTGKCSTIMCRCYRVNRECDPDLCGECLGGTLELTPESTTCKNMALQRKIEKKLYVAPSDVAGWGCFLGEEAAKNDLIAEYVGEIITQEERRRIGLVYGRAKCSYMFEINNEYCVDAASFGSKIRFANHSSRPNCEVRIPLVNGDHRIGVYANRNIKQGEELFYDYGSEKRDLCPGLSSSEEEDLVFKKRRTKKKVRTRQNARKRRDPGKVRLKQCTVKLIPLSGIGINWKNHVRIVNEEIEPVTVEEPIDDLVKDVTLNDEEDLVYLSDSIDELLVPSSSESYNSDSSIEILSSEGEMPTPLRVWRIKKEIKMESVIQNVDEITHCDNFGRKGSFGVKNPIQKVLSAPEENAMDMNLTTSYNNQTYETNGENSDISVIGEIGGISESKTFENPSSTTEFTNMAEIGSEKNTSGFIDENETKLKGPELDTNKNTHDAPKPYVVYDLSSDEESENNVSTDGENSYAELRLHSNGEDLSEVEDIDASVICEDLPRQEGILEYPVSQPNRESPQAAKQLGDWDVIMVDAEVPEILPNKVTDKNAAEDYSPKPHSTNESKMSQTINLDDTKAEIMCLDPPSSPEVLDIDEDDLECEILEHSYKKSIKPSMTTGNAAHEKIEECDDIIEVSPPQGRSASRVQNDDSVVICNQDQSNSTYNHMKPSNATAPEDKNRKHIQYTNKVDPEICDIIDDDEVINIL